MPNPLLADPTRTGFIRKAFIKEIAKRFDLLKQEVYQLLITEDAFGLVPNKSNILAYSNTVVNLAPQQTLERHIESCSHSKDLSGVTTLNTRFSFHTDEQKLQAFRQWLGTQVKKYIVKGDEDKWWDKYLADAYKKGQGRAFDEVSRKKPKDLSKSLDFYKGTRDEFLRNSFGQPETKEKIKLLAARTFNELEGVTDTMSQVLTRTLMDGVAQGKNPRDIATDINKSIDSIGIVRANTIARTEVARAHNEATLDSLEKLGVDSLNVMVEWKTTYPHLVVPKAKKSKRGRRNKPGKPYMVPCKICAPLNGVVLTVQQARGMFPRHPNCLCVPVPANVGESTEGQKRTPAKIRKAIDLSLRQEAPQGVSLAEQREQSNWVGGDLKVTKGNYATNEYRVVYDKLRNIVLAQKY